MTTSRSPALLHELLFTAAERDPDGAAVTHRDDRRQYGRLARETEEAASAFRALGVAADDRVAVFLEKRPETVTAIFAAAAAGGAAVPINPHLKPRQVEHIVRDSGAKLLVTSAPRCAHLAGVLEGCPDLAAAVLVDGGGETESRIPVAPWGDPPDRPASAPPRRIDSDMAAILYTSGSTGRPKGVVLSHRNLVAGAESVTSYLGNTRHDRLLGVLPLSFDYGFSQLTTAFRVGAEVVLLNHLLARDIVRAVARHRITGLAAVPPLWIELAGLEWPPTAAESLRYITNSGGAMPAPALDALRARLPATDVFLMYGLTEAFRSTYLPPAEIDRRPGSIGKPIPNADIAVVCEDGSPCAPDEPGELVHRGPLVSMGYWNAPEATARRFRPAPGHRKELPIAPPAVWSGDTVRRDSDGYLYFIGRRDEMIKTSGYRVSPQEVEEELDSAPGVAEVAAVGAPHPRLGEAIIVIAAGTGGAAPDTAALLERCRRRLPAFMVPAHIIGRAGPLPRNANGKIDRAGLKAAYADHFADPERAS